MNPAWFELEIELTFNINETALQALP